MANCANPGIDDDFTQLYKEYAAPLACNTSNVPDKANTSKRSHASSDEDEKPHDPNAIPTGFTCREAKLWEAKSKATERNWRKRKEEELICKVCGETGHFTQACPSTLGANRKSRDFVEKVSAREEHVKAFFTEKVIHEIEKDIGCKLIVEEKFIVVSGKDRLILSKGTNAVRKVKEEAERKHYDSQMRRSISPEKSSVGPQYGRSDSQGSYPSPRNASQFQQGLGRHDKAVEDLVREDFREMARASSRGEAFAYDGASNCSRRLKSPTHPSQRGSSCTLYEGHHHRQNMEHYITDGWDAERQGSDKFSGRDSVNPAAATPQTLEELELELQREAMDLERIREKQEEEENKKHQEVAREIREKYIQKLAVLRGIHAKQREEYHLLLDVQRMPKKERNGFSSVMGGYRQLSYWEYDKSAKSSHYPEASVPMGTKDRSADTNKGNYNNSLRRPHDGTYHNFQRRTGDDYGKASDRY